MAKYMTGYELTQTEMQRAYREQERKQREWDLYFLHMAELVASKSCDTSLKVGCVLVGSDNEILSTGYNGFPRNVEPSAERLQRPTKYSFTEHAERNAIYNAAKNGIPLKGCTAYVACLPIERGGRVPCNDCARAFVQAGIKCIVEWHTPEVSTKDAPAGTWRETIKHSYSILREAGMRLKYIVP